MGDGTSAWQAIIKRQPSKLNSYGLLNDEASPSASHTVGNPTACVEKIHDKFCDGCLMDPIAGQRFSCQNCEDYDLCGGCHSKFCQGQLQHISDHRFVEQPPAVYEQDGHLTEILLRISDVVEGAILRRKDTSRIFYGNAGGLESDESSLKFYLSEGEYITRSACLLSVPSAVRRRRIFYLRYAVPVTRFSPLNRSRCAGWWCGPPPECEGWRPALTSPPPPAASSSGTAAHTTPRARCGARSPPRDHSGRI